MLVDVTGEEFETLMEVVSRLNYIATEEGSQQVASLISDQAELNTDFQVCVCVSVCVCVCDGERVGGEDKDKECLQ